MPAEKEDQLDLFDEDNVEEKGVTVDKEGKVLEASQEVEGGQDEDEEEPAPVVVQGGTEDREAIREARRIERQDKKQRARERDANKDRLISSLQRQVNDLSARVAQTHRRQEGFDIARLDAELASAEQTAAEAQQILADAVEKADGKGAADANELYYAARKRAEVLKGAKEKIARFSSQPTAQLDPGLVSNAKAWMGKNEWFSPTSTDEDSMVTRAIDDFLAAEGYDPRTSEYWDELDDRLAKKLPHRYRVQPTSNNNNSTRVSGSGKNSSRAGSPSNTEGEGSGFYLSPARVRAIKDAGKWDDAKQRTAMIKRYKEYDAAHKGN